MTPHIDYDHAKKFSETEHPGAIYRCDFKDNLGKHWFYIGKTSQTPHSKRIYQHYNGDQKFDQRVRPYWEQSQWMIVEMNIPISQLDAREAHYIDTTNAMFYLNQGGLNFQWGGYKKSKMNGPTLLCPFCGHQLKLTLGVNLPESYRYVCEHDGCPNMFKSAEFHYTKVLEKFTKSLYKLRENELYNELLDSVIDRDNERLEYLVGKLTESYRAEDRILFDKETKYNAYNYLLKYAHAKTYDDSNDHGGYAIKKKVGV